MEDNASQMGFIRAIEGLKGSELEFLGEKILEILEGFLMGKYKKLKNCDFWRVKLDFMGKLE